MRSPTPLKLAKVELRDRRIALANVTGRQYGGRAEVRAGAPMSKTVFSRLWELYKDPDRRSFVGWLSVGGAAVLGATWTVFTYVKDQPRHDAGNAPRIIESPNPFLDRIEKLSIEKAQDEAKLALAQKTGDPQSGAAQAEVARLNVLLIVTRKQLRGVELIDAGRLDEALAELVDAEKQLDKISTGSAQDRNQRGYTYKTYAQVFREKRDYAESVRYADLAQNLFQLVRDESQNDSPRAGQGDPRHRQYQTSAR
jgi:hypothetical protein